MTGRWGSALMEPVPVAPDVPRGRWSAATMTGTSVVASRGRWGAATLTGTAAVIVVPPANRRELEPGTHVPLTATLSGGGTADSWSWRRISGATLTINGTGPTVTVTYPHVPPTADGNVPATCTIVIGIRATVDGTTSPERQVTLTGYPYVGPWFYNWPATPTWTPSLVTV